MASNPAEFTAFAFEYTKKATDLTEGKYRALAAQRCTRAITLIVKRSPRSLVRLVIRYASVRDPSRGMNLALLTCRAFANTEPIDQQTWRLRLSETGAQAVCEMPKFGITFDRKSFAVDPRIAKTRLVRT